MRQALELSITTHPSLAAQGANVSLVPPPAENSAISKPLNESSFNSSTSYYVCSECGCSIYAEEQNYDCENLCPSCNQTLDGNECTYCGYDLGSDFD